MHLQSLSYFLCFFLSSSTVNFICTTLSDKNFHKVSWIIFNFGGCKEHIIAHVHVSSDLCTDGRNGTKLQMILQLFSHLQGKLLMETT